MRGLAIPVHHAHIVDEMGRNRMALRVAKQPRRHGMLDERPDVDDVAPADGRGHEDPRGADLEMEAGRVSHSH